MFYSQMSDQFLDVGVVVGGCLESAQAVAEVSHHYGLPMVGKLKNMYRHGRYSSCTHARTHTLTHSHQHTHNTGIVQSFDE